MKILLVTPPEGEAVYGRFQASAPKFPPLGLCYIGAVLEKNGFDVEILDCPAEGIGFGAFEDRLKAASPRVVGFTASTIQYNPARRAARAAKELCPGVVTLIGGAHLSAVMEEALQEEESFDLGVYGEGEITTLRLMGRLRENKSFAGIKGVLRRETGRVVRESARRLIRRIDALPFPARHLLKDLSAYTPPMTRRVGRRTASVITSRGCPMNCAFCDQSIFGRSWRGHTAAYVAAELEHLVQTYGIDSVTFEDDFFTCSKERVMELCDRIVQGGLCLQWGCSVRCDSVSDELLDAMKRAGCRYLYVGIESGSQRILDLVNKGTALATVEKGIRQIKRHGLHVVGSAVVGFPTETLKEIKATVRFVLSLPLDGVSFFLYTPYPNTETYRLAKTTGTLREDWDLFSAHPRSVSYVPEGVSERFLNGLQKRVYLRFYLRPRFVLSHLREMFRPQFLWRAAKTLLSDVFS